MAGAPSARRFRGLPRVLIMGHRVPVARGLRARLLGLALLAPQRAGPGLLIPRCRCVHTLGMRFSIDVVFLDARGNPIEVLPDLRPRRMAACPGATAVLELPSRAA